MTTRLRPTLMLLALAAALAVPGAAATEGEVTAEQSTYGGGATYAGETVAFYLSDEVVDPDADPLATGGSEGPRGDPVLGIDIEAAAIEALVLERHFIVAAQGGVLGGVSQADPRHGQSSPPQRIVLEQGKASLVAQQADFQVHVVPRGAQETVRFEGTTHAGRYDVTDSLFMGAGRFQPAGDGDEDVRDPASPQFWQVRLDQPLVVHDDQAGQTDITFTGDLVLEAMGVALQADDQDDSVLLESGIWTDPGLGTGLPLDQPVASAQRTVLLRLFLEDATVRITVQGGSPGLSFAAPALASQHGGEATLLGVTGSIAHNDQTQQLDGERYVLPAGHTVGATPRDGLLALSIAPTPAPATPATRAGFVDSAPTAVAAWMAVLALLAAAGLGLARRLTGTPDLRQVETAIEGQRYGRAARLAKRILRARPGLEDAILGRAIALSKSGRAGVAVTELSAFLSRRDASDGSLHYVLGLAFLDLGRHDDARVALNEAVRRTPALQADVVSRLGQQGSSAALPTVVREAHGYA